MLIFRRLLFFRSILALAAIAMAATPVLAQGQPTKKLPIRAGTSIQKGEKYVSQSGKHYLFLQDDGNLIVQDKEGRYVWGLDQASPKFSQIARQIARIELQADGGMAAFDAQGNLVLLFGGAKSGNSMLDVTFSGALQVVAGDRILWSSDGNLTPPLKVFLIKADITEDRSQLASEPGWDQCWVMRDPAIKIFATTAVSKSAINAVANIYVEMTHRLHPKYPRAKFNGFKVYITNEEYGPALKRLNTVKDMWKDGTDDNSRDWLLGGASTEYLWITEQMICKTGVKTRAAIGRPDNDIRTFDQVVHEFAHSIDFNHIDDDVIAAFNGPIGPVEGFAIAVQHWFGAPGRSIPDAQKGRLSGIFTSQASFSPEGYGAEPNIPASRPQPPAPAASATGFPDGYFYMTTKSAAAHDLVLESAPVTLRKAGSFTGMFWKAKPVASAPGYFHLTSQFLGEQNQVCEGGDGKGAAVMVPNKGYSGTAWKAVPAGDGYYYLTTAFMEPQNKVLNGNTGDADARGDDPFKGLPHMVDKKSAGSGALWKFVPRPSK